MVPCTLVGAAEILVLLAGGAEVDAPSAPPLAGVSVEPSALPLRKIMDGQLAPSRTGPALGRGAARPRASGPGRQAGLGRRADDACRARPAWDRSRGRGPQPGRRIIRPTQDPGTGAWVRRDQVLSTPRSSGSRPGPRPIRHGGPKA